ncbi:MAG: DCC1-like thiol-disulfide oxidoreductase family protein [Asticcacaulis sp.]
MGNPVNSGDGLWLVYDGDCPLCRSAAQAIRLKATVGQLHIINAREADEHPLIQEIRARGLDLNAGIVVRYQGQFYHGAEGVNLLALLGSENDRFNRFNRWVFGSKARAECLYPALKAGRGLLLRLRGKSPL